MRSTSCESYGAEGVAPAAASFAFCSFYVRADYVLALVDFLFLISRL